MGFREKKIELTKDVAYFIQQYLDNGAIPGLVHDMAPYKVEFEDEVMIQMKINYHGKKCDLSYILLKNGEEIGRKDGVRTLLGAESFVVKDMVYVINVGIAKLNEVRETLYVNPDIYEQIQEFLHFGYGKLRETKTFLFELAHDFGYGIMFYIDVHQEKGRPVVQTTLTHGDSEIFHDCQPSLRNFYEVEFDNTRWILDIEPA